MYTSWTLLLLVIPRFSNAQRAPCTPTSSNVTTPSDDVPAIQAAFRECGNGGTILIPSSRLYQIGSPLTFSSCHGCTFQVDGTLNVSEVDVNKWLSQPAIFQLAGASNVTISGSGLINGKNWTSQYGNPTTMFNLDSASDIRVSGLTIKSPRATFFNIRNSRDLKFSSLSLSTNVDPNSASKYSSWVFGFQIEDSFNVDISPQTSITGVSECVRIGYNVNSTSVFGLNCAGGDAGVYINVAGAHNGETLPFSNLSFTNLTIEDAYQATGIKAWGGTFTAENITWQNVSVHGVMVPAYVTGCGGSGCYGPGNPGVLFKTRNISWVGFTGQSKTKQSLACPQLAGAQCDWQVRDFNVKVTGCPQC